MARLYVHGRVVAEYSKVGTLQSGTRYLQTYRFMEDGKILKQVRFVHENGLSLGGWKIAKIKKEWMECSIISTRFTIIAGKLKGLGYVSGDGKDLL